MTITGEGSVALQKSKTTIFDILLYTYVILLPIGTGLAGIIGSISLMNYISIGIMLCGIVSCVNRRVIIIYSNVVATLLYYLYTVLSVLWSPNASLNWYVMTNAANFVLLLILNLHEWKENEIESINRCVLISQLVVFYAVVINISSLFSYRLSITIVSTIGTSDFACGLCLIIALWMRVASTTSKPLWRVISFVAIAVDAAIIIMAGSRGALVMVAAMVLVWLFLGSYTRKTKIAITVAVLAALFILSNYFMELMPATITNRLTLSAIQSSRGSGRFNIWGLAWETFVNSDIIKMTFGNGFDSFLHAISYGSHGGHQDLLAHNVFVQTMIEGGIVGLVLLLRMMITQIRLAWKTNDNMMKIALVGLFVAALSIDMQVTRIWGFILALNLMRNSRGTLNENNTTI